MNMHIYNLCVLEKYQTPKKRKKMKNIYLVLLILTLLACGFAIMGLRCENNSLKMEIEFITHPEPPIKVPAPAKKQVFDSRNLI